jgi:hypothetical protein
MPDLQEHIQSAGDIIWDHCALSNAAQTRLDILSLVAEMHIFEDMFSHTMHGSAYIIDTQDVFGTFPIIGQEILYVKFNTPKLESFEKAFRVVKVAERSVEGNKQVYRLFFVSLDGYFDVCFTENRSLIGTPDHIIADVHDKMWNSFNLDSDFKGAYKPKHLFKTPSNVLRLVSPQWSPIKCIKWAEQRAVNKYGSNDWVYFETFKGIHFLSLTEHLFQDDNLFTENDNITIDGFVYDHAPTDAVDLESRYRKIHKLEYVTTSDQLSQIMNRAYGQKVYNHDLFNKKLSFEVWRKDDVFGTEIINTDDLIWADDPFFKITDDAYTTVANTYPKRHNDITEDKEVLMEKTRLSMLGKLEAQKLNVEVWGRTDLTVGNKVLIYIGNYTQRKADLIEGDDLRSTASYLITAIHHRLSPSQHKMSFQCIRESTLKPLNPL